jgi:putative endopeptidase
MTARNVEAYRAILERAARPSPGRDAIDRMMGDHYAACMDEPAIEARGTAPLRPALDRIAAVAGRDDLADVVADLHRRGVRVLFQLGAGRDLGHPSRVIGWLDQGGLGLPHPDAYLAQDPRSRDVRRSYLDHIGRMFVLVGLPRAEALADAARVSALESALAAHVVRKGSAQRHRWMTPEEVARLAPAFAWRRYFHAVGASQVAALNVAALDFLIGLDAMLRGMELAAVRAYLRWQLLRSAATLLPRAFVEEQAAFYGRVVRGAEQREPRWKLCVRSVESLLGEALARRFAEQVLHPEDHRRLDRMVAAIRGAFAQSLADLTWMANGTREHALAKLAAVDFKIGLPAHRRDDAGLVIARDDALGNAQRARQREVDRELARIGAAVDPLAWPFAPTRPVAAYDLLGNDIVLPAPVLQAPFFDRRWDDAANFGAIGAVIAHELTHAFDDGGRKVDAGGAVRDWWTADDARAFSLRSRCFVEQYSSYAAADAIALDGTLTLDENLADHAGLKLAHRAFASSGGASAPSIAGFTPDQRFFISYAQAFCENRTETFARAKARSDRHAPGRHRVNGVVANLPAFSQSFACKAGQPMVRQDRCQLW